jgi:hypothetical protein
VRRCTGDEDAVSAFTWAEILATSNVSVKADAISIDTVVRIAASIVYVTTEI